MSLLDTFTLYYYIVKVVISCLLQYLVSVRCSWKRLNQPKHVAYFISPYTLCPRDLRK